MSGPVKEAKVDRVSRLREWVCDVVSAPRRLEQAVAENERAREAMKQKMMCDPAAPIRNLVHKMEGRNAGS